MNKQTVTKNNQVIATYTTTVTKRDLDEIMNDVIKSYPMNKKLRIVINVV